MSMKIDLHKSEINSRTEIIDELQKKLENLKQFFMVEKDQSVNKSVYIKDLLD